MLFESSTVEVSSLTGRRPSRRIKLTFFSRGQWGDDCRFNSLMASESGTIPSSRCWDDCCGYTDQRTVRLRDRKLRVLYYIFTFSALVYVIGYNIFYQQLCRRSMAIVGTARIQLRPSELIYSIPPESTSFCGSGPGQTYSGEDGIPFLRQPCQYWDNYDSVYPSLEDSGVKTKINYL